MGPGGNTRESQLNSASDRSSSDRGLTQDGAHSGGDGTNVFEPRRVTSFGRTSSSSSSWRGRSLSFRVATQTTDDIESENVSEAGDIGDRALRSGRFSESGSLRLSLDNTMDDEVVPVPEDVLLQSYALRSRDSAALPTTSPVSPLPLEIISPLPSDSILYSRDDDEEKALHKSVQPEKESSEEVSLSLEYISCLLHLSVFGILGVFTRYLLQKLFGPSIVGVTSDRSILYLDLPSNMLGSFLMGWLGVVFKGDICSVSDLLAIGLTTGYLGSLTTFSGWNQKMLDLSVRAQWVFTVLGFTIGMFLADYSIILGIETAKGFRWLLTRNLGIGISSPSSHWRVNSRKRHLVVMVVLLMMLALLWGVSGAVVKRKFVSGSSSAQLWLACLVAPPGVWIRWLLARLNGKGLGQRGLMKWVPFGTLLANVSASCVMAALATLKKAVNTRNCDNVANGIQLGFLGCLSTVSTFIAEFRAMKQSKQPWKAYVYATVTVVLSFAFGTLIYSVPVWKNGYD